MAANSGCCKLLVKKLPSELSRKDKEDLLKHFGAQDAICMDGKGRMPDAVFATFADEQSASRALSRLHQLKILGNRIVVEFADSSHEKQASKVCKRTSFKQELLPEELEESRETESSEEANQMTENKASRSKIHQPVQGMNPKLGIHYQPNSSLHYLYPPPSAIVLTNIANALACVPKLYVQVLHLMNKMNLPCPFGAVTPTPPLPGDQVSQQVVADEDSDKFLSSEESELESDEEEKERRAREKASIAIRKTASKTDSKAHKRTRLQPSQPLSKKPKLTQTGTSQSVASLPIPMGSAFDQPAGQQAKKIEFKLSDAISTIFEGGPPHTSAAPAPAPPSGLEGFGTFAPPEEKNVSEGEEDSGEEMSERDDNEVISLQELMRNRMPEEERCCLSAFKRYSPGEPTCRLYVKNLARQVEEEDLRYIFGRYVQQSSTSEKDSFDIRLMKEGRMKGQAFISLPSESRAKRALREVHGYVLHGKPMVIQFSRSSKAKE